MVELGRMEDRMGGEWRMRAWLLFLVVGVVVLLCFAIGVVRFLVMLLLLLSLLLFSFSLLPFGGADGGWSLLLLFVGSGVRSCIRLSIALMRGLT